ncbi:uncharacterized protein G2W53_042041 [Senna tora]|uniref:Uncharacterized protein n=1 Tax=Senna tora TaxID=362788 RepID=A0A834SEP8_9FABA|nr:uncharacterized protein G2W53_042041 [Senna tora]
MDKKTMGTHFVKPIVLSPLSFLKSHFAIQDGDLYVLLILHFSYPSVKFENGDELFYDGSRDYFSWRKLSNISNP